MACTTSLELSILIAKYRIFQYHTASGDSSIELWWQLRFDHQTQLPVKQVCRCRSKYAQVIFVSKNRSKKRNKNSKEKLNSSSASEPPQPAVKNTGVGSRLEKPTVCLNMIVKDEEHVIARCLNSVKPYIDYWVIADTGSSDRTPEIIKQCLRDIPGELVHHKWKNFGHNRTEAIRLAENKADYIFTIDADEYIETDEGFSWGALSADVYQTRKFRGRRSYFIPNIVRSGLNWQWVGVLHEHVKSETTPTSTVQLSSLRVKSPREGARASAGDHQLYTRDALLLQEALLDNPDDSRSVFYLAQSYRDAEDAELAIRYYGQRASMGDWHEEVFVSLYQIATIQMRINKPWETVLNSYLRAYAHSPKRIEPLYYIGIYYAKNKIWPNAWLFLGKAAQQVKDESLVLFVEHELYDWRVKMEAAVAAYYVREYDLAIEYNNELLNGSLLPDDYRSKIERNLGYSQAALKCSSSHNTKVCFSQFSAS